jgi:hypothetical protein
VELPLTGRFVVPYYHRATMLETYSHPLPIIHTNDLPVDGGSCAPEDGHIRIRSQGERYIELFEKQSEELLSRLATRSVENGSVLWE